MEDGCMDYTYSDCPNSTHCQMGYLEDQALCVSDSADGCHDNIDNDNDGWIDSDDPDCKNGVIELGFSGIQCNDNYDNDRDGKVDRADPNCESGNDILELN